MDRRKLKAIRAALDDGERARLAAIIERDRADLAQARTDIHDAQNDLRRHKRAASATLMEWDRAAIERLRAEVKRLEAEIKELEAVLA